jgi:hypothetical protein
MTIKQPSPARVALAALVDEKSILEDRLRRLTQREERLRIAEKVESDVQARIAELNASEASAMAAYSNGGDAPTFDVSARNALETEASQAAAQAAAARIAIAPLVEEISGVREQLRGLPLQIQLAKLPIVLESLGPLIDALEADRLAMNERAAGISRSVDFVVRSAHELGRLNTATADIDAVRPVLLAVEKIGDRILGAMDRRPLYLGATSAVDTRLADFVAELGSNTMAQLTGVA